MYKVSVIVPVYKAEKFIERCVRTLMEQTLDRVEYIFVDDCGGDDSIAVVQRVVDEYPHRKGDVRVLRHQHNMGAAAARCTALQVCQGECVLHVDSDDYIELDMLEKLYREMHKRGADAVLCGFDRIYKDGKEGIMPFCETGDKDSTMAEFVRYSDYSMCNIMVRREVYERMLHNDPQAYKRTQGLHVAFLEDAHLLMRLLFFTDKICHINDILYHYNQENESSVMHVSECDLARKSLDSVTVYNDLAQFFADNGHHDDLSALLKWRGLEHAQRLILDGALDKFEQIYRRDVQYIKSHPNLRPIMKTMMLAICLRQKWLVRSLLFARRVLKRAPGA